MANKTYIYCGSNDMSIMKLCLSTVMLSQFEMVTLLLGHPVQCFNRDENDLAPYDKYYIRGKRNALWFWQHFARTITLAVFDIPIVSTESQVLYSFIIKVRLGTPILYFLSSFNSIVH